MSFPSTGGHCEVPVAEGEPEHGEPGEVDCGGEEGEVGGDFELPADPGAAAAVAAAHQVADLPFHFGPGGLVVSLPGRVCLAVAGGRQAGLMGADGDGAAFPRGGALGCQRAGAAGRPEPGGPGVAFTAADADGHGNARRAAGWA